MDQMHSEISAYGERKPYFQLNAEKILAAVKTGEAPFLSQEAENEKATVTITPTAVRSAETGRVFRGTNQLLAQVSLKEIGSTENEIITYQQTKNHDTFIKKGSPHFTMTSYDAEEKKSNAYRYYPVSAVHDPKKLPQIPERSPNHDMVITCTESEPEKYLGKYLAATSLGARFETSREIMSAFQKNLETDLEKSFAENRHTRVFELGNKASEICRDTLRDMRNEFRESKSRTHEPVEQEHGAQGRGAQKHGQSRESGYAR
jgi:hypothetical protein